MISLQKLLYFHFRMTAIGSNPPVWASKVLDTLGITQLRPHQDRKSTRLNSSHTVISYAVFCLKKKIPIHIFINFFLSLSLLSSSPFLSLSFLFFLLCSLTIVLDFSNYWIDCNPFDLYSVSGAAGWTTPAPQTSTMSPSTTIQQIVTQPTTPAVNDQPFTTRAQSLDCVCP